MKLTRLLALSLVITASLSAQSHTVRGSIEDVQGTPNSFFLDCTTIPVQSSALDLNLFMDKELLMTVVNIGTATSPILRVDAAQEIAQIFGMGNLRLGKTDTWEVSGAAGSTASIFYTDTLLTGFAPLGSAGSVLLGPLFFHLATGTISPVGQFKFVFNTPNLPAFVGLSVTSQALVVNADQSFILSNPDCKVVEN